MIIPTVGRVVYFRPGNGSRMMMHVRGDQPLRADIVYVWSDRAVSLNADDHEGRRHFLAHVALVQDGETPAAGQSYCEWMPYQKAVAKGEIAPTLHATKPTIEELERLLEEDSEAVHINPDGTAVRAGSGTVSTKGTELDSH